MTHAYQSPTTFCEVTYDSDWFEDDRHVTPYRYSLLRTDTDSNSDTVSLTLPSYTYYEYLRSLYDCRTAPTPRYPLGYTAPSLGSASLGDGPPRATTWHAFNKDSNSELSRQAIRSEPSRIRPTYPFPTLHLIQQGESGDECDDDIAVDRAKQKLIWVDALNKWVPESQLHPKPYISFIGNVPCVEKPGKHQPKELYGGGEDGSEPPRTCDRYQAHMGRRTGASVSPERMDRSSRQRTVGQNNDRRDAARKKALDLAEQRKHRKAYSTPLYTSMAERQQKVRVQSSRVPHSTPVSPTSHLRHQQQQQQQSQHQLLPSLQQSRDRVPAPREVWQSGDGRRSMTDTTKPTTPARREISITLVTPKPEETVEEDTKKSDKKVTFEGQMEQKAILRHKKPKDAEDEVDSSLNKNNNATKTLSPEQLKARQREAEEKARLEELSRQESLSREGTLDSSGLHRSASSRDNEYQENVYENTMNAAAKRRKGKSDASKQKGKSKPEKPEKPEKTKKGRKEPQDKEEVKAPPPPPLPPPPPKPKDIPKEKPKEKLKEKPPKAKPVQVNGNHVSPSASLDQSSSPTDKDVKPAKPSKPMLVGMRQAPKPPSAMAPNTVKTKTEKLPITKPSELEREKTPEPESQPEGVKPQSPGRERRQSILEQRQIIKKEKREQRRCSRKPDEEEGPDRLPDISGDVKKVDSWIYGEEDFTQSPDPDQVTERVPSTTEPLPSISADLSPEFIEQKKAAKEGRRKSTLAKLIATDNAAVKWRRPGQKDSSYQDELRRLELAEERRKKQMELYERLRKGKMGMLGDAEDDGGARFEDYGFLSRYCIFNQGNIDMYKHAFDAVDESGEGWLEGQDVMIALRGANNRLTEAEEEYLYRVLELTGYQITHGADFKMFSVLAALSQKISSLDNWMKNMIGKMDFKQLEMKMFKCKELWDCNVDKDTNTMTVDDLCVELRAGGVSLDHEMEVRDKLAHMPNLDLLDFLSYVPLFIMIHEAVVQNPLDDTRTK